MEWWNELWNLIIEVDFLLGLQGSFQLYGRFFAVIGLVMSLQGGKSWCQGWCGLVRMLFIEAASASCSLGQWTSTNWSNYSINWFYCPIYYSVAINKLTNINSCLSSFLVEVRAAILGPIIDIESRSFWHRPSSWQHRLSFRRYGKRSTVLRIGKTPSKHNLLRGHPCLVPDVCWRSCEQRCLSTNIRRWFVVDFYTRYEHADPAHYTRSLYL